MQEKTNDQSGLESGGWKQRNIPGFIGLAGPLWMRRDDQGRRCGILIEEKHLNPVGVTHGGVLTTLIDHAVSIEAWEANERRACVTVDLSTHFTGAAQLGEFVQASVELTHVTGSLLFLRARLDVADRPIAQAQAIMKRLRAGQ